MRSRRHFRDAAQQRDVLRAAVELIVGHCGGDGLASGRVVLLRVGMQVQTALGDFGCVVEILDQVGFADIQQFNAHVLAEVCLIDQ